MKTETMKKVVFFITIIMIGFWVKAQPYNRVVSLTPSITKSIYDLNAQSKLVGCTNYCTVAKNDNKEIVASAVSVNIERVVKLRPDLVMATGLTNSEDIEMLKKFNLRVAIFETPKSFEEICQQYIEVAKLLGKEDTSLQIVSAITKEIDSIKTKFSTQKKKKIFFEIGSEPLFSVIPNTFMNDYILFANGINIITDDSRGTVSRENVIIQNPDYIFITTMGVIGDEEKQMWQKFSTLNATKNGNIFFIDPDLACVPTPQDFLETMKIIAKCME